MTVTSNNGSDVARTIVVRDEAGPLEFAGESVADLSWTYDVAESYGHVRWTDLTLYRVLEEGSEWRYVIQIVGRSVVYHKVGDQCSAGIPRTVAMLKRNPERWNALRVCPTCDPEDLEDLAPGDVVAVEEDLPTLHRCRSAAEVVNVMHARSARERKNGLSLKLLQISSEVDEDIADELRKTRRL
jgi:hypothetical protein